MQEQEWNPNGESYDFALEEYSSRLAIMLQKELTSYGMQIDKFEASRLAKKWLYELEASKPEEVLSLLSYADSAQNLSHTIVENILLNIAEERPGTNPWKHEAIIPMPLHLALSQIASLSLASTIAFSNSSPDWAQNAQASIIAASNYISNKILKKEIQEDEAEILVNDEVRTYYGEVVYLPQPAVAYLARFFENMVMRIIEQGWTVPPEIATWTEAIASLKIQSDMLRYLNKKYGRPSSATPSS
jgi:hypothetical protein